MLTAAQAAMERAGLATEASAPVITSAPLGPSRRRYANGAAVIITALDPPALLACLKQIERSFGRRHGGQRWAARVIDLDIVLWQGGAWASPRLIIPHVALRQRGFVLGPAATIAPGWRDPITGLSLRQLAARHRRAIAITTVRSRQA